MDANGDALIVWEQVDDTGYSSVLGAVGSSTRRRRKPRAPGTFPGRTCTRSSGPGGECGGRSNRSLKQQRTEDGLFEVSGQNHHDPASAEGWAGAEAFWNSGPNGNAERPQVAINDAGDAVAVWTIAVSAVEYGPIAIRSTAVGGLRPRSGLEDLVACLPQVAVNHAGWAVAVLVQFDGAKDNILVESVHTGKGGVSRGPVVEHEEVHGPGPQLVLGPGRQRVGRLDQMAPTRTRIFDSARLFTQPLEVPE